MTLRHDAQYSLFMVLLLVIGISFEFLFIAIFAKLEFEVMICSPGQVIQMTGEIS